ncbi:AIPR family protein, partial [Vibrio aerogenes]
MTTLSLDPSNKPQSNFVLPYHSLRNISCPDDTSNNRKILSGHVAAKHVLEMSTNENVRTYLLEAEGKKRKVPTAVHRAIRETLENSPEKFSVLNGGLTIVCSSYSVDEKKKILTLVNPSIINGAQTQGILRDYYNSLDDPETNFPDIHISYQLIVTEDTSLVAEISISRNFQNDVKLLSISGKLSYLDDLAHCMEKGLGKKIKRSETDVSDSYIDTEKLLQVLTAFIPEPIWVSVGRGELSNKTYAYNQKAKCLKEFI